MMSRQKRLIYLPMAGTILLCLLVGVYLFVWKRFSKSDSSAPVTRHSVETPADDALAYWTANKMHNAKAAPLPEVNAITRRKGQPGHPGRSPRSSRPTQE